MARSGPLRPATRRRLDTALVVVASAFVAAIVAIGAVGAGPERIRGLWAGAVIDGSGTTALHEAIDWDFGAGASKHGIYRDVPDPAPTDVVVTSPDAPADLTVLDGGSNGDGVHLTQLRIGDPNRTINGRRHYDLRFTAGGFATAPGARVAWNAVGRDWTVGIDHADLEMTARFELLDPKCETVDNGGRHPCTLVALSANHLVVHLDGSLAKGRGVQITATVGPAAAPATLVVTDPSHRDHGAGIARPTLAAFALALLGGTVMSRRMRRAGREEVADGGAADAAYAGGTGHRMIDAAELAAMATIEFAPPKELDAAQGGVVLDETVQERHKVAWLMEEAIAGSVELTEDHGTVTLHRTAPGSLTSAPVLESMFAGRSSITLGTYDKVFAAGWARVGELLSTWQKSSGLWDPAADRRRRVALVVGSFALVVGGIVAISGGAVAVYHGVVGIALAAVGGTLAGGAVGTLLRSWELRSRTAKGSGLWLRTESFRRFLHDSEGQHARQAADLGVLREYTAWAVSVGELDRWNRAVKASSIAPDPGTSSFLLVGPMLFSATSHSATAPSSHSGGGGGGSMGGGGGGGGGGSW